MKRVAFVITNPDLEFALNAVGAIAELSRQGRLEPVVCVRDLLGRLPGLLAAAGVQLPREGQLRYFPTPDALAAHLKELRRAGGLEQIYFNEFSELFFSSFLDVLAGTPHVVHDIHILEGLPAFLRRTGYPPKELRRFLLDRAGLLRVYYIFPGFEYLYENYGFPASMRALCRYSFHLPLYQSAEPEQDYVYSAGDHMRDYALLHRAARGLAAPVRIRTTQDRALRASLGEGAAIFGETDYLSFTRETAAARCVALPLVAKEHISCGLSFLAHCMALGKAIVTTRCPSTEGYIEDGVTGLLTPPADAGALRAAIARLLDEPALRVRLAAGAAGFVRRHMDMVANLASMLELEGAPRLAPEPSSTPDRTTAFLAQIARLRLPDLHRAWLPRRLAARDEELAALRLEGPRRLLLVNATKGQQLYPSITDFFAALQRLKPGLRVASASYFDIHELQQDVAAKGLEVLSPDEVERFDTPRLNQFAAILFVGPSEILAGLMSRPGLKSRLVYLDLAFYHRLLELDPRAYLETKAKPWPDAPVLHKVLAFSCQSPPKVAQDVAHCFELADFEWRWFNYIPIGFDHAHFFRSQTKLFDVALLGTAGRDYATLDSERLAGRKILSLLGSHPDESARLLSRRNEVFVAPRVEEPLYARLLALSRCVVLPLRADSTNVFLSVNDALASGLPLITCRHPGAERILAQGAPLVLYDPASKTDLFDQLELVLRGGPEIEALGARGLAFAREHLDIHNVLFEIAREIARQDG
jgi:glycosyltransferase involved in cell wall biosynthesis